MYGFLEDYQTIIECAKQLQDHIEAVCDESGIAREIPQVSVSLGQYAAIIEVSELQIWHSEDDSIELTPEMVIESFTEQCGKWSRFSAEPSAGSTLSGDGSFAISCEWVNRFGGQWNGDVWKYPIDARREIQWGRNSGFLLISKVGGWGENIKIKDNATRSDLRDFCKLVGVVLSVDA